MRLFLGHVVVAAWLAGVTAGCAATQTTALATGHDLPPDPVLERNLLGRVGSNAMLSRTAHFSIVADTSSPVLTQLESRLESTFDRVLILLRELDIPANPLQAKLPVVLLIHADAQTRFADSLTGAAPSPPGGQHDPRTGLVVFRCTAGPNRNRLSDADPTTTAPLRRSPCEMEMTLTTPHETAHQLMYAIGVLNVDAAPPPTWLIEGLATLFEIEVNPRASHPWPISPFRLRDFRAASEQGRLLGPSRLIRDGGVFQPDRPAAAQAYAEAWALTYYLLRTRPAQFAAYLRAAGAKQRAGLSDPLQAFEAVFGRIDAEFEHRWVEFILRPPQSRR